MSLLSTFWVQMALTLLLPVLRRKETGPSRGRLPVALCGVGAPSREVSPVIGGWTNTQGMQKGYLL